MLEALTASYEHLFRAAIALVAVLLAGYLFRRWWEDRRAKKKLAEAVKQELNVPQSLHPVIDPDICIGSGSCINACPEGKILGLVDGVATLVNASKCIGHGKCAAECPVSAIKLVFGSAERGVELPEVDEHFETSRPGVHIVGELAGMGLIKNALTQGLQVAARLKETIGGRAPTDGVDVVIVGAGPAGIATAVGCRAAGLTYALVEQDTVGGTVAHYPRQKLVMTETVDLPFYGKFGRKLIRKEESRRFLSSRHGEGRSAGPRKDEADRHRRRKGQLRRHDRSGDAPLPARGTGDRAPGDAAQDGRPRRGAGEGRVPADRSAPVRGQACARGGRRRLRARGGDPARRRERCDRRGSRTESPSSVAAVRSTSKGSTPTSRTGASRRSCRARCSRWNATRCRSRTARTAEIPNDFVIACLGGELPNEFLKSIGVSIRKHHGDKAMANPSLARKSPRQGSGRAASIVFALLGFVVVAGLVAVGWKYYLLPRSLRYKAPEHAFLKPGGTWGHGVGVLATLFMLLNFIYPLRKRLSFFKGKGSIAPWLRFHIFVGIMSPLVILFHTAFQWGNQLATTHLRLGRGRRRDRPRRPLLLRLDAHRSPGCFGGDAARRAARRAGRSDPGGVAAIRRHG